MRKFILSLVGAPGITGAGHVHRQGTPIRSSGSKRSKARKRSTWVRAQNERSLKLLQADPRYEDLHAKALTILEAKDRIPQPGFRAKQVYNFWQDDVNVRGLVRRTTVDGYRDATPAWETVLDVDALAKAENANWVYKGAGCLPPEETHCLVNLSDGGKDAVEIREFDNTTKSFVADGFKLAGRQAKRRLARRRHALRRARLGPGHDDGVGLSLHRQTVEARHEARRRAGSLSRQADRRVRRRRRAARRRRRRPRPCSSCATPRSSRPNTTCRRTRARCACRSR